MDDHHLRSAEQTRWSIVTGRHEPARFRAALQDVPPARRDAWVNLVLGLDEHHDDGPDLPRGCVPYLPCPVDVLLRAIDQARIGPHDVFVDIGSGPGRATALVHLLTGAGAVGIEVQPQLIRAARDLASRLRLSRIPSIHGDASVLARYLVLGSVFLLYCPFSGARLDALLDDLEPIARTRCLRICCVSLTLPPRPWLRCETEREAELAIYRSLGLASAGRPIAIENAPVGNRGREEISDQS